jgi:hypothetical protein
VAAVAVEVEAEVEVEVEVEQGRDRRQCLWHQTICEVRLLCWRERMIPLEFVLVGSGGCCSSSISGSHLRVGALQLEHLCCSSSISGSHLRVGACLTLKLYSW